MIKGVAVKLKSGAALKMEAPFRHHHCFMVARVNSLNISKNSKDQGFYTDDVDFIDRKAAMV